MSDGPKSAYELAMERLRRKDAEAGVAEKALTGDQKAQIAEARSRAEARIAELKILHASRTAGLFDPLEREAADAELRREIERVTEERDRAIARIRES
jgi:hypothetical protein